MAENFEPGDQVEWNSEVSKGAKQGVVKGVVEEKLTAPKKVDGGKVNASPDDPTYVVRADADGSEEAHGASNLRSRD